MFPRLHRYIHDQDVTGHTQAGVVPPDPYDPLDT